MLSPLPTAQALATPLRMCTMTRTRIPVFFMQDFALVAHPDTGRPWWLPRSLLRGGHSSSSASRREEER